MQACEGGGGEENMIGCDGHKGEDTSEVLSIKVINEHNTHNFRPD